MSRIQRVLTIYTSLGQAFNYTLQATVPPHTLSKCSASLPRPNWEPVLYYTVVCVMGFILFCILVASYFEADRIFVADILKGKVKLYNNGCMPPNSNNQIFDLKALSVSHNGSSSSSGSSPKPAPLPANLLSKFPRPGLDIPNGHIPHKSRETIWTSLKNTLKNLIVRKSSSNKKKIDNNNSINSSPASKTQAESKATLASNQSEKEKAVAVETITPEKSNTSYNQPQQKVTLRKTKAAKRSHAESTTIVDSHNVNNYDRKQRSNNSSVERRSVDNSNIAKETTTIPNVTVPSSIGLDTFDDIKLYDSKSFVF